MQNVGSTRLCGGFTTVELLVTLSIAAILVGLAVPAFGELIRNNRATAAVTRLAADLQFARSEAIKRNVRVLVCRRATGSTCGSGTSWEAGWVVCYDSDSNASCDPAGAAGPNPIRVAGALSNVNVAGPSGSFWFAPAGNMVAAPAGTQTFSINNGTHKLEVQSNGSIGRP